MADEHNFEKVRCWACQGSKQVMGGGCMLKDCETCNGEGHLYRETQVKAVLAKPALVDNSLEDDEVVRLDYEIFPKRKTALPRKCKKNKRGWRHREMKLNVLANADHNKHN